LAGGAGLFFVALLSGAVGPAEWGWIRITLLGTAALTLTVVATVPDHFLDEHLWRHVVLEHVPRMFVWTLGALALVAVVESSIEVDSLVGTGSWLVLVLACLLGVLPESGPHLLIVTLFAHQAISIGVLTASSIVQDGHGMLPILAHSWRDFARIKAVNLVVGLLIGGLMLGLG
jgi:hypothetical protein